MSFTLLQEQCNEPLPFQRIVYKGDKASKGLQVSDPMDCLKRFEELNFPLATSICVACKRDLSNPIKLML